jgi:hypothetical protein
MIQDVIKMDSMQLCSIINRQQRARVQNDASLNHMLQSSCLATPRDRAPADAVWMHSECNTGGTYVQRTVEINLT